MVTTWQRRVSLMWSTIAARVDVRPEPARPQTRTNPDVASASCVAAPGRPSESIAGTPGTTRRRTTPTTPRSAERAHPEATEGLHRVDRVDLAAVRELPHRAAEQQLGRALGVRGLEHVEGGLDERAVDAHVRARTHLQVDVGGALLDRESEELVEIQHALVSTPEARPLTHSPPAADPVAQVASGTQHLLPAQGGGVDDGGSGTAGRG